MLLPQLPEQMPPPLPLLRAPKLVPLSTRGRPCPEARREDGAGMPTSASVTAGVVAAVAVAAAVASEALTLASASAAIAVSALAAAPASAFATLQLPRRLRPPPSALAALLRR